MVTKAISFSVFYLILDSSDIFGFSAFSKIPSKSTETYSKEREDGTKDLLWFLTVFRSDIDDRYIFLKFCKGNKLPYQPKVTNPDLTESDNPRKPDEIEPSTEWFVLIDCKTHRFYISDIKQKNGFANWLAEKIGLEVNTQAIFVKKEFVKRLTKINKLSFRLTPNLFSETSSDRLESELSKTIFGFGAERATLIVEFHEKFSFSEEFKKRLSTITESGQYEELTLIGVNTDNMESILNVDEIINKISLTIPTIPPYQLINSMDVSTSLINQIEDNEKIN